MIKIIINSKTAYEKLNAQYEKENYQQLLIDATDLLMVNTLKNEEVDVKVTKLESLNAQVRTHDETLKLPEKWLTIILMSSMTEEYNTILNIA